MTEVLFRNIDPKLTSIRYLQIRDWLEENFGASKRDSQWRWIGGRWWIDGTYSIRFTHSKDAAIFILRWV
jgi:hypothetical protein